MHGALGVEQLVAFVSAIAMAVLMVVEGGCWKPDAGPTGGI
jgi:hypothetical protein